MAPTSARDLPGSDALASAWRSLHPPPPLPLTAPFSAGLGPLLDGLCSAIDGVADGRLARGVIAAVGDRISVTVGPDGVTSRGWLRTHQVAWADAEAVVLEPVQGMATRRVVAAMLLRRVPVPGLRWLVGRVVDPLAAAAAHRSTDLFEDVPQVLVAVRERDGEGVRLEGELALVSLLSRGLTVAAVEEASRRVIPVERRGEQRPQPPRDR